MKTVGISTSMVLLALALGCGNTADGAKEDAEVAAAKTVTLDCAVSTEEQKRTVWPAHAQGTRSNRMSRERATFA